MDLPQRYVRTTWYRLAMEHKKNKEELEEEMRIYMLRPHVHSRKCIL